jgi:hypothetical protein
VRRAGLDCTVHCGKVTVGPRASGSRPPPHTLHRPLPHTQILGVSSLPISLGNRKKGPARICGRHYLLPLLLTHHLHCDLVHLSAPATSRLCLACGLILQYIPTIIRRRYADTLERLRELLFSLVGCQPGQGRDKRPLLHTTATSLECAPDDHFLDLVHVNVALIRPTRLAILSPLHHLHCF